MKRKCIISLTTAIVISSFFTSVQASEYKFNLSSNPRTDLSVQSITPEFDSNKLNLEEKILNFDKKDKLDKSHRKISSNLLNLVDAISSKNPDQINSMKNNLKQTKSLISANEAQKKGLNQASSDLIYVYISFNDEVKRKVLNTYINKLVSTDENKHLIAAWIEVDNLQLLSSLEGIESISTVMAPITNKGSVTTEGERIHNTDLFRDSTLATGKGIKIGVISDGVDSWTSSKNSGDLPDINVLSNARGGDEGTAMLEIVHDLAPDAELYFHDSGTNVLEFNKAVDKLVEAGCKVITDDIGWLSEPFFEDGIVASHIATVIKNNNIVYVSSAGNDASIHYQGMYKDYPINLSNGSTQHTHDFDSTKSSLQLMPVLVPAGQSITAVLQWDDKFGSSSNDYDLYILDDNGSILTKSANYQQGNSNPFEGLNWYNTSSSDEVVYINVDKFKGVAKNIELFVYGGYILNYGSAADSIYGHPSVPDVIAVGAVNASVPSELAYYSSQGPVTINYPSKQTRKKPDVCGIDGVSVTGAGGFSKTFYGTSASAPHVAALTALVWSQNTTKKSSEVRNMIVTGTTDLGTIGYDSKFGNGLVNMLIAGSPSVTAGLVTTPGDKTISLNWITNVEPDLNGYQLEYKKFDATTWTSVTLPKTATTYTVSNLINGISYEFRIKAKDISNNWSNYSAVVSDIPKDIDGPPIPTGFKITSVNDKQAILSWTAIKTADLAAYQLEYKLDSDTNWTSIQLANINTYTITGLQNEKSYSFRIRSIDTSNNYSQYSALISGIPIDKLPPAVPKNFVIASISNDTRISLSWSENTEVDLDYYEIICQKVGTSEVITRLYSHGFNSTEFSIGDGLIANTKYTFKIRAMDKSGNWSPYSTAVTATAKDLMKPFPIWLSITPGDRKVTLTWPLPYESDINGYQLEYRKVNTTTWSSVSLPKTATTYTVTNLINGTQYEFRIKVKDTSNNWSDYSGIIIEIPRDNEASPVPTNLKITSVNDKQATLSWTAVKSADLAGYQIEYKLDSDTSWTSIQIANVNTYTVTGLKNEKSYSFRIRSVDTSNNYSQYSDLVSGVPIDKLPPAVPKNFVIASIGDDTSIAVSWTLNTEDDINCYEIVCQKVGTAEVITQFIDYRAASNLFSSMNGLIANTKYSFKIRAKDNLGNWSSYSNAITATTKDLVKPYPTAWYLVYPGDKKVNLSWCESSEPDVNGYQLEYRKVNTTTWSSVTLPKTTTYTVTNLINGTEYEFRIKVKDTSNNWSDYCYLVSETPRDNEAPPVPTNLKITSVNDKQATLSWTAVKSSDFAGYQLEYKLDSDTDWTLIPLANVSTYTITGLQNEKLYNFRIRSVDNSSNYSQYSDLISGTPVDKLPPAIPKNFVIASIGNDTRISLSWSENAEADLDYYEILCQKVGTSEVITRLYSHGFNSTEFSIGDGLIGNTKYTFKIRAMDKSGNWSSYSTAVTATAKDVIKPFPTYLCTSPGDKKVVLTWTLMYELDENGCQLEYRKVNTTNWSSVSLPKATTTYTVSNLVNGTPYEFRIKVKDTSNNWSDYSGIISDIPIDNESPIPTGFKISSIDEGQITLSWNAVRSTDLAGYLLDYKEDYSSKWSSVLLTNVTTYTIKNLTNLLNYNFRIKSIDKSNNYSAYSDVITGFPSEQNPPAVPKGFIVSYIGDNKDIAVSWDRNDEPDIDFYEVVCQKVGTSQVITKTIYGYYTYTSIFFLDTDGLVGNTKYSFKIRAVDFTGKKSSYSSAVTATTKDLVKPAPTTLIVTPGDKKATLSWYPSPESDINGYQLEYRKENATTWSSVSLPKTATNYILTSLINGTPYEFRIKIKDTSNNWSDYSNIEFGIPMP